MSQGDTTKEKLQEKAQQAGTAVKDAANDTVQAAKAEAVARGESAKNGIADEMHSTASALRRAADEVRDGSPQGTTFSYLANGLADMADSVKGQDMSDMVSATTNFARRNPIAFLGGAALLGFAATRFAKASHPSQPQAAAPRQAPKPSTHSTAYNPNIPTMEARNV